jgi:phage baseplate assembly protein W
MSTYRGLSFPFRRGPQGFPQPSTDQDTLWESVVQLLQVGRNERVMRPDAGSQAAEFVFENNTEVLAELVAADVSQVLARYEPRILVTQIETTREDNGVVLDITYVQRSTGQVQTRQITLPTL